MFQICDSSFDNLFYQAVFRCWVRRQKFCLLRSGALTVQKWYRLLIETRRELAIRQFNGAVEIQRWMRGKGPRHFFKETLRHIIHVQVRKDHDIYMYTCPSIFRVGVVNHTALFHFPLNTHAPLPLKSIMKQIEGFDCHFKSKLHPSENRKRPLNLVDHIANKREWSKISIAVQGVFQGKISTAHLQFLNSCWSNDGPTFHM